MKKVKYLLFCLLLFTGCVKLDVNMSIGKDKSMNLEVIEAFDKSLITTDTFNSLNLDELKKEKFKIEDYSDDKYQGYKISKKINNIDDISTTKDITSSIDISKNQDKIFKIKKGFLKNKYTYNAKQQNISDLQNSSSNSSEELTVSETLEETLTAEGIQHDLSNYQENNNKVNIYLFRGNGCSHCKELLQYISNSLIKELGDKFNLVSYEVWENEANGNFMKQVSKQLGEETDSVPYLVIGKKVFNGYSQEKNEEIKSAINELYNSEEKYDAIIQTASINDTEVSETDITSDLISNYMNNLNGMDLKMVVNLPYKVISSNATNVENNGKKLTWDLMQMQNSNVNFEFEIYNIQNIIIVGIGGLLLIIIVIIVLLKSKKKSKKNITKADEREKKQTSAKPLLKPVDNPKYINQVNPKQNQ